MRCPSCGGYEWINDKCKFCGYVIPVIKPRFELGKVDLFELVRLLKEKREKGAHNDRH